MSPRNKTVVAFITVCLAWGASYMAIKVGLRTMPPSLMGAIRYGIAGLLIWAWCDFKGHARPTLKQWGTCALFGLLFVVIGNGAVIWAEETLPSGIAALLMAVTPAVTLLFEWLLGQRTRPNLATWVGLAIGLFGVGFLAGVSSGTFSYVPILITLLGTIGWSLGSALSLTLKGLESPIRAIGAQMLTGSLGMLAIGLIRGEQKTFLISRVDAPSVFALFYLIFVASIAAYVAYGYLIRNVSPMAAGICSYVNPVVAMFLGGLAGERIGIRELISLFAILIGVALLSRQELIRSKLTHPAELEHIEIELPLLKPEAEACAS